MATQRGRSTPGPKPRASLAAGKLITIRVTAEELADLRARTVGPLSAWLRDLGLAAPVRAPPTNKRKPST